MVQSNAGPAPDAVTESSYYKKQQGCQNRIIAWSHTTRFEVGLRLLGGSIQSLLDYGCGDGTFLAMASGRIRQGCGVDLALDHVEDARKRLAGYSNLTFHPTRDVDRLREAGAFDV